MLSAVIRRNPLLQATAIAVLASFSAVAQQKLPDLAMADVANLNSPVVNTSLRATIRNDLNAPTTASVVFYKGNIFAGPATEISRQNVTWTAFQNLTVQSNPVNIADGELYSACVDPDKVLTESNENNNCSVGAVSRTSTELSVATHDVSISPVGAAPGEAIKVSAIVRSLRPTAARALVRLFQGHPESPVSKLLATAPVSVSANGATALSWNVTRPAGDPNFFVQVTGVWPRDLEDRDNLATRNLYVKAIVDTGRAYGNGMRLGTMPAIGDLFGTGQPILVFAEHVGAVSNTALRLTALQVFSDGTTKEHWSKQVLPPNSSSTSPAIADLDGDGSLEIVLFAAQEFNNNGLRASDLYVYAFDKNGNEKWKHKWSKPNRGHCVRPHNDPPVIGDMNKDGIADIVTTEDEIVIVDGKNGAELSRKPLTGQEWCSLRHYSAVADLDADGTNELVLGGGGIWVFDNMGNRLWHKATGAEAFTISDIDKDGRAELVTPTYNAIYAYDGKTGTEKRRQPTSWRPYEGSIAATTSYDVNGFPAFVMATNAVTNNTVLVDATLATKWSKPIPLSPYASNDNPSQIALADLLGQGRPQLITRSPMRSFGIQDLVTGEWVDYMHLYGWGYHGGAPIPADIDGDGKGDVLIDYGKGSFSDTKKGLYEAEMPAAQFLVFSSEHWKKLPITWNQQNFVPEQVDRKLSFRHDYQPYKTHNTWFQQPMRKPCDIDWDDDVDQTDVNLIFAARNTAASGYDPRDYDKDRVITVNDSRACALKCTKANCAVTALPGQILSISPRMAQPGTQLQVTIRGEFVNLKSGITKASFGPGISVGGAAAGAPGPVSVINSETAVAQISIPAGQSGLRSVSLTTGADVVTRADAFALSAGNKPPVVTVSPALRLTIPASTTVSATVSDDGLPNGKVHTTWQVISGLGTVQFSNPDALSTNVTFSEPGLYHLRFSAFDGQYVSSGEIGVTVQQGNEAPFVSAGPNISVRINEDLKLAGEAHDDGYPLGSSLKVSWSRTSGPGTVTFTPAQNPVTLARFTQPGVYVLKLQGTDGALTSASEVTINVLPPLPVIELLTPASATPGQVRTVTLTGKFTNFVQGQTQASFGPGISVGGGPADGFGPVTVVDARTATAQIAVLGGAALGSRPVTVRTAEEVASKEGSFTVGTTGVPYSIRLNPTDVVVAPGESMTARPEVLDAAGNVLTNPAWTFTLSVTPKPGASVGAAPVVNGMTVSFPKLVKRLLNHDPEKDPTGEFTDGDPTDPNYGKETGGLYTLVARLNGLAVQGSEEVAVIPSGTAHLTIKVDNLADALKAALQGSRTAAVAQSTAAAAIARDQLQTLIRTIEYSPRLLANNNVLAPPNGFPVTPAQAASHFPVAADDEAFGKQLDKIIAHVRLVRQRVEALQVGSITPETLDALRAGAATWKALSSGLDTLKPGPVGVTRNGDKINLLMRTELPLLLHALGNKSVEALNAAPGVQNVTALRSFAAVDPGQVWDVFSNLFSIFTDLAGYAKANIIELGISLANDLANMALANLINDLGTGELAINLVQAGGQFSFICPRVPNTYVEASGLSSELTSNSVAVIGCINSYALRNLLTLKPSKDLAGSIRLFSKIKALTQAAGEDQSIASVEHPDYLREGLFGGSQMVFISGWPKVNQGRIPCVGVVIAFNLESGAFHAVNANVLPQCQ